MSRLALELLMTHLITDVLIRDHPQKLSYLATGASRLILILLRICRESLVNFLNQVGTKSVPLNLILLSSQTFFNS